MLDVNTDCAVCVFPDNKLPFRCERQHVVKGYYYDFDGKVPKYRVVPGEAG